jgi:hypothetical protein
LAKAIRYAPAGDRCREPFHFPLAW